MEKRLFLAVIIMMMGMISSALAAPGVEESSNRSVNRLETPDLDPGQDPGQGPDLDPGAPHAPIRRGRPVVPIGKGQSLGLAQQFKGGKANQSFAKQAFQSKAARAGQKSAQK